MKNNSSLTFSTVFFYIALALIIVLPNFLLPNTNNFTVHSKTFLIILAGLLSTAIFFIQSLKKQSWKITLTPVTLPALVFALVVLASSFFANQYPVKSLLGLGGVLISSALMIVLGGSLIKVDHNKEDWLIKALMITASALSVTGLMQLVGFGPSRLISHLTGFSLPNNLSFSLTGSVITTIEICVLALTASIVNIIKQKKISNFDIVAIPLVLFGLGLHVWSVLPGKETSLVLPPFTASWSVMLDSLRSPRNALIGQGPEYYQNAYAKFKPLWVNGQSYWQTRFSSATNFPMTLLASTGLLGLAAWVIFAVKFFRANSLRSLKENPVTAMIALTFVMQLLLPASAVLLAIQALLIIFWIGTQSQAFPTLKLEALSISVIRNEQTQKPKNWVLTLINLLILVGVGYLALLTGKAYSAYHHLYLADKALLANDVVGVYDQQRLARNLNPYLAELHRTYALTNLQIAVALANKTDATEEEKNQVSQLIQQAVNEARNAVSVEPTDSDNWVALARIYQNLIGSTEGADQWAINSYVSAIENEPNDPFKRIDLGGILFTQQQFAQAANIFQQAINIKPDIPAGYYQLAMALAQLKQYPDAQEALKQTLSLLAADSEDYKTVNENLEKIKPLAEQAIKEASAAAAKAKAPAQQSQTTQTDNTPLGSELNSITEQNLESPNPATQAETTLDQNLNLDSDTTDSSSSTQVVE